MAFDLFGNISGQGAYGIIGAVFWVLLIGIPALLFIGGLFYWMWKKKVWNLDVEIKMPRSDGKLITAEWGKGCYDANKGVVFIKRNKKKKAKMKPFDITKYIQGTKILTVIQLGAEQYIPVLNESWVEMRNDQPLRDKAGKLIVGADGEPVYETAALLDIMIDTSENKAWRNYVEREAKATYSIMSLLREYATYIGIGFIIVCQFVGFAILWSKVA